MAKYEVVCKSCDNTIFVKSLKELEDKQCSECEDTKWMVVIDCDISVGSRGN